MRRRRFLQGVGGLTVGLPMLSKFAATDVRAHADSSGPRRVITMAYQMGTHVPLFLPTATGSSFDFGPITASMEPFKDRTLVVSDCPNAVLGVGGNTYIYGHPGKKETVFTGTLHTNSFGQDGANHIDNVLSGTTPDGFARQPNGPSFDRVIGEFLQDGSHLRPSVDLGVAGGGLTDNRPSDFFYEARENPVTLQGNPDLAFASLFDGVSPDGEVDPYLSTLRRRKKSVLDAVRESFVDLRQGLPSADRAVLDDHADKIRQVELDLPAPLACTIPDAPPDAQDAYADWSMGDFADMQIRLMTHAMACGVAPVGRLEFFEQQDPFFGIPLVDDAIAAVDGDWHHPIVHASDGWAKDGEVRVTGLRFFVEKFARLCGELDAIVDGADGQTLLDTSLCVLGSDLGEGDGHASNDLCFLIAGGSGPGRRQYHFDGSTQNVNRLLNSLLHMACVTDANGAPIEEFGLSGFAPGIISELFS